MTLIILTIIGMLLAEAAALMRLFYPCALLSFKTRLPKMFGSPAALPHLPFIMIVIGLLALVRAEACRLYFLFMQRRTARIARTLSRHLCNPPQTWAAP